MNKNASFIRKVAYLAAIALLLIPLSFLCQPSAIVVEATASGEPVERTIPGGRLAQLRAEYDLSHANLGEIDPGSATLKLATLGMDAVAANILWGKANEFKKTENWEELRATLNQIIKLQPHFLTVWEFQAHNLSYNISVEFDNFEHRYHWVKKGIDFLMLGTRFNRNEPRLLWYVGWIIGQKIGRSDESVQFRRLYRKDDDFHALLDNYVDADEAILRGGQESYGHDNWKMSKLWHEKSDDLVDRFGAPLRGKSPLTFFSKAPMAQINCATDFVKEFRPEIDGVAQNEWRLAWDMWNRYGNRQLLTSYNYHVTLNGEQEAIKSLEAARREVDLLVAVSLGELTSEEAERIRQSGEAFACQVRKDLEQEKRDDLKRKEPELYEAMLLYENARNPDSDLPVDDYHKARQAQHMTDISDAEIVALVTGDDHARATKLLHRVTEAYDFWQMIGRYKGTVNYTYWATRCEAEATDEAIRARQYMYDARDLVANTKLVKYRVLDEDGKPIPAKDRQGNPLTDENGKPMFLEEDGAKEKFEKAWVLWRDLFEKNDRFATLWEDDTAKDLVPAIREYRTVLLNLSEKELPADFPLMKLLGILARDNEPGLPSPADVMAAHAATRKDDTKKDDDNADNKPSDENPNPPKDDTPTEENKRTEHPTDDKSASPEDDATNKPQPTDPSDSDSDSNPPAP